MCTGGSVHGTERLGEPQFTFSGLATKPIYFCIPLCMDLSVPLEYHCCVVIVQNY